MANPKLVSTVRYGVIIQAHYLICTKILSLRCLQDDYQFYLLIPAEPLFHSVQ